MFETVRIRTKLILALAIPMLTLIGLSSFVVVLSSQQADEARERERAFDDQVALATAALGPRGLIGALQTERNSEALTLAGVKAKQGGGSPGQDNGVIASASARDATDTAVTQFVATIAGSTPAVQQIYAPAVASLSALRRTREAVDASTTPVGLGNPAMFDAYRSYSAMVRKVFEANGKVAIGVDDAELRNGATIIDLWSRSREDGADLVYAFITSASTSDAAALKRVADARTRDLVTFEQIGSAADGPYRDIVARGQADPRVTSYRELLTQIYNGESKDIKALIDPTRAKIWGAYSDTDRAIADQLQADALAMRANARQVAADAQQRQRTVIFVGIGALTAAAAVTLIAARSIARPLRRLAGDAELMAASRLPQAVQQILDTPSGADVVSPDLEPVPTGGGAEINDVAIALNSVQSSATDLAIEQALLRRTLEHAATFDRLTGCHNRASTMAALERALSDGSVDAGIAVLFIDLDRFKPINDELGHAAGDQLLVTVAQRLRQQVRAEDLVGRLGGDEFLVVCPGTSRAVAERIAERITDALMEPVVLGETTVQVGASIGISWSDDPVASADSIVATADSAMYEVKRTGRTG